MQNTIKGFFAGSGIGAFSDARVIDRLLHMTRGLPSPVKVAYLGTATYDLPEPQQQQTALLAARGCVVRPIYLADTEVSAPTAEERAWVAESNILLVSGGNTLYAIRRWEETGIIADLRRAAQRPDCILAGGSAGAICWFAAGHSDSADPTTYMRPMLLRAMGKEEEAAAAVEEGAASSWSYIRVHGLGFLPGVVCPHYDVTQSNAVRREDDFAKMMKRHSTERGIGIDHWAVLVLPGDGSYEVWPVPNKKRDNGTSAATAAEAPGVYIVEVDPVSPANERQFVRRRVTEKGTLDTLLRPPLKGQVVPDPFERYHAMENPTAASGSLLRR